MRRLIADVLAREKWLEAWLLRNGCAVPLWRIAVPWQKDSGAFARLAPGSWSFCPGDVAKLAAGKIFEGCGSFVVP